MDEGQLLARALDGDRGALEQLCRETWPDLYSFVYWQVQSREEAEDIVQEAYSRLLGAAPHLKVRDGDVNGLLRTIATNLARDGWRRRKVRGPLIPLEAVPESHPIDETTRSEERLAVRAALSQVPSEQRAVIELRLVQGYTVRETARLLGKSEVAVRSLQYRGLQRLAELMAAENPRVQDPREGGQQRG